MTGPPPIIPLGSTQDLLETYGSSGGVLEFVLVDALNTDDPHRQTMEATIEEIRHRHESWIADRLAEHPELRRDRFLRIDAAPAGATDTPVSLSQFLGRCWDAEEKCLRSAWSPGANGTRSKSAAPDGDSLTDGYAEAFLEPPYGLQVGLDRADRWFGAINDALLGGLSDDLEIRSWSTDWSNWFDAGHEWWGVHLWTVRPTARPWMVGIAASTTD